MVTQTTIMKEGMTLHTKSLRLRLAIVLCFASAVVAQAQQSFVTFSAHVAVPQRYINIYSREGPGVTGRFNYSLSPRWMAVALAGIEEFRRRSYLTPNVPTEVFQRDARIFPLQGGIRFNLNKDASQGQLYMSALGGIQIVQLEDSDPGIDFVGRYHHFNAASELGYKVRRVDFNAYFNWGGVAGTFRNSRYFTLGMGVNLFKPGT